MAKSYVDANYRFIAAYQEVNARIAQRQHTLALYVTLLVSLLAALVALKPGDTGRQLPIEWIVLGFPVASMCFAFLNYKAELAITNLRQFLSTLERLDNAHETLPSYNTDPKWAISANKARRFHDFASAVLVAGGNAIGLGIFFKIYPERSADSALIVALYVLMAAVSLLVFLVNAKWTYLPSAEGQS